MKIVLEVIFNEYDDDNDKTEKITIKEVGKCILIFNILRSRNDCLFGKTCIIHTIESNYIISTDIDIDFVEIENYRYHFYSHGKLKFSSSK